MLRARVVEKEPLDCRDAELAGGASGGRDMAAGVPEIWQGL